MIEKYIKLITQAVNVKDKKYVFINMPLFLNKYENIWRDILEDKELYFDYSDVFKKHDLMRDLDQESINKHPLFDASIYDEYAKLDAAFIFIESPVPGLMNDIDPEKIKNTAIYRRSTQKLFRELYEHEKLNWNISAMPNEYWAEKLNMSVSDMWDLFYKIYLVDESSDPYDNWLNKLNKLNDLATKLNDYNFDYLEYTNKLGTNLKIYLPENHIWESGASSTGAIVNLPTEEVFTSPQYNKIDGIVYSTKPLLYGGAIINDFYIKLENGKIIDYDAKEGKEVLKSIIEFDDYSCYLGECALVSYDSPINNTNIIFNETLFDENASCHLAIGAGFGECVKGANDLSDDELRNVGINDSKTHVDFMIGSRDLKVIGTTKNGEKITIMENGNIIL